MSNAKAKVIAFPKTERVHELMNLHGFTTDDTIRLTEDLQMGRSARFFSDPQLDFIEAWGGDDSNGTFYDAKITNAYGIEPQPGDEEGEYTWPKLAAILRRQKNGGKK
jgi:hypothetical protein